MDYIKLEEEGKACTIVNLGVGNFRIAYFTEAEAVTEHKLKLFIGKSCLHLEGTCAINMWRHLIANVSKEVK